MMAVFTVGCLRLMKIRKNVWFSYSIESEEMFQRKVEDFCNFAPFFNVAFAK